MSAAPEEAPGPTVRSLRADGLTVAFGSVTVVPPIAFEALAGQWTAITGPSGSGKSVLLLALAGLLPPVAGRVLLDDEVVVEAPGPGRLASDAGRTPWWCGDVSPAVVAQDSRLHPLLTVEETVSLPRRLRRGGPGSTGRPVRPLLADLGLAAAAGRAVGRLSGGQRQRVALGTALASGSPILLLDEPVAELDGASAAAVRGLLQDAADRGCIVVLATTDPALLASSAAVVALGQPASRDTFPNTDHS